MGLSKNRIWSCPPSPESVRGHLLHHSGGAGGPRARAVALSHPVMAADLMWQVTTGKMKLVAVNLVAEFYTGICVVNHNVGSLEDLKANSCAKETCNAIRKEKRKQGTFDKEDAAAKLSHREKVIFFMEIYLAAAKLILTI